MLFDRYGSFLKLTKSDWEEQKPYWNYEDIGIFLLTLSALSAILDLLAHLHLLARSERDHPGFYRRARLSAPARLFVHSKQPGRRVGSQVMKRVVRFLS